MPPIQVVSRYTMKSAVNLFLVFLFFSSDFVFAQKPAATSDHVLMNLPDKRGYGALAVDKGSAGLWGRLQKLQTIGSAMHTTAHPDDEHAGLLTYLSRGEGQRTALLTINRGEGGANATGSELFDALGMVRTEELRLSARYYGLDDQYFTSFTDYGYSKTLDEALTNWGRENVLRDMVRIIRRNRPFVVISRFHGSRRDGHGHHQAAGGITPEAFEAAGDPSRFTEEMALDGTKPWKPFKLYRGGIRNGETWHVEADPGQYNDLLGMSYQNFGYYGLSLQRSQTSGRYRESMGASTYFYERLDEGKEGKEAGFFDGIDTSISGTFDLFNEPQDATKQNQLNQLEARIEEAVQLFDVAHSEKVLPALADALKLTRALVYSLDQSSESTFVLRVKEKQLEDAINTALGIRFTALGLPAGTPTNQSPWAPLTTMGVVVPGQAYEVKVELLNPSNTGIEIKEVKLESHAGLISEDLSIDSPFLANNESRSLTFHVTAPEDVAYSGVYFSRATINDSKYDINSAVDMFTPRGRPAQIARMRYAIYGVDVALEETVRTRRANLPNGYELDDLKVAPRVAVNASPSTRIVPLVSQPAVFDVEIEVLNNDPAGIAGVLKLDTPAAWEVSPASIDVSMDQAGQKERFSFRVSAQGMQTQTYPVNAVVELDGRRYDQGYEYVDQDGLGKHYLYRPAQVAVHGLDVNIAADLNIGYIMGVGDEVPAAISQLGATVNLLTSADLESSDLSIYDAIVVGTRAYAVRQDLLTFNSRLIDYARAGGHMLVLYQTPEYQPGQMAPYPATLPRSAEEISEEDAPVEILAPDHPVFQSPNKISGADFDNWVEQRGSKFFATWDDAYLPMVVSNDTGQDPQRGGWLMADVGEGHFTYFAYAIHRQAPFAVPGALRIFANLLSYSDSMK